MTSTRNEKLNPLPRLKSLVLSEVENIKKKTPINSTVFVRVFLFSFIVLALSSLLLNSAIKASEKIKRDQETKKLQANKIVPSSAAMVNAPDIVNKNNVLSDDRLKGAISTNDQNLKTPLGLAPIEALEESIGSGAVPRISDDGRKPWYVYSRPFDRSDPRPRVAIIVAELGLARLVTETAISDLPGPISLAFSVYSSAADAWSLRARSQGHETLISIPMEPLDYPISDPGPNTLLTKNNAQENKKLLLRHMQKGKGYLGVTTLSGSRLTTDPEIIKPILEEVRDRGLLWFDARITPLSSAYSLARQISLPSTKADFHISEDMGEQAIDLIFKDAAQSATQSGKSIVMLHASPLTIRKLKEWIADFPEKGLVLAPISAVAE
jgi:polysaccharide deacetylase 2 family uncharacterized protein YibQ